MIYGAENYDSLAITKGCQQMNLLSDFCLLFTILDQISIYCNQHRLFILIVNSWSRLFDLKITTSQSNDLFMLNNLCGTSKYHAFLSFCRIRVSYRNTIQWTEKYLKWGTGCIKKRLQYRPSGSLISFYSGQKYVFKETSITISLMSWLMIMTDI